MAFRYLIYSTGTTFAETIVRESNIDNPGANEASYFSDFIIPEIQPLYLWRVTGSTGSEEVVPNTDQNIYNYLQSIAPPPSPEDDATVGFVTGETALKIDIVTGATGNLGVFLADGNLEDSGFSIAEITGATSAVTYSVFNAYTAATDTRLDNIESDLATVSAQTDTNTSDIATVSAQTDTNTSDIATVSAQTDTNTSDISTLSATTETKLDSAIFTGYTATTQPVIDSALTGVTNLGTGTTLLTTSGRNVESKSVSVLGGLTLLGDANNIIISGGSAAVWGNISGTLSDQTDLWNELTGITAETANKLDTAVFDSYTGTTETRLQGIESDISSLSAETATKLDESIFTGYTATTETRLQGIETDITELSAVTTVAITGATNGLTKVSQDVELGGTLTKNTTISGLTESLTFNTSDLTIQTAGSGGVSIVDTDGTTGVIIESDGGEVALVGNNSSNVEINRLSISDTSMTITDGRGTTVGLQYAADYSLDFTARSLVDKGYVDAVAEGLTPKAATKVATTTNIDLTGGTFTSGSTIDGEVVLDGWRVLVKDQTEATENGIWVFSGSSNTFYRSEDFNGSPDGEVVNGNIIPVTSGDTQYNSLWVLVTPNPITLGTSDLNFTLFSSPHELIAGTGIDISGNTISIDGTSLAGSSIVFTGGTFNVDPTTGNLSIALDAKLDVADFNSYSAATDTRLDGIENDVTFISGVTDSNFNTFTGYTATTETRLSGIESDISSLSAETTTKLNESVFTGYTATTETRLQGIEDDITGLSATTATKLDTAVFTGYTASTTPNEIFLIHTGGTDLNTITTTAVEWDSVNISGSSYSWTGGSDIFIQETASYEVSYNIPYNSQQNNRDIAIGANLILNNNTVLDTTSAAAQASDNGIAVNIALPTVILSLTSGDKLTLGAFRTGDNGTSETAPNASILIKKKETLQ